MKLNIIGYKNYSNEDLQKKIDLLKRAYDRLGFTDEVGEALSDTSRQLIIELNKRERGKYVWVEFVTEWSGYSNPASSGQRREVGRFYRKLNRDLANKLPNYYQHHFTDNTTNDWYIKQVSVRGKDKGSYSQQVDDIINSIKL